MQTCSLWLVRWTSPRMRHHLYLQSVHCIRYIVCCGATYAWSGLVLGFGRDLMHDRITNVKTNIDESAGVLSRGRCLSKYPLDYHLITNRSIGVVKLSWFVSIIHLYRTYELWVCKWINTFSSSFVRSFNPVQQLFSDAHRTIFHLKTNESNWNTIITSILCAGAKVAVEKGEKGHKGYCEFWRLNVLAID